MFKVKFFNNGMIIRSLMSAKTEYVINKQKQPRSKFDVIKYPFLYTRGPTLDINSRLITVEGCFGVNKEEIAKKIANYFGLNYYDDVKEWDMYNLPVGDIYINFLKYNDVLPGTSKIYSSKMFWNDTDPIKQGKPLMMQLNYYNNRYFNCCKGMANLVNHGDGFVTKRSPFADYIMALTFKELGLMSEKAFNLYNLIRAESIPKLWRPHFIVYVKASPEIIRKNLKKRNSYMLDSCNFTDKFIETYQGLLEKVYLEKQSSFSRIITLDLNEFDIDNEDEFNYTMDCMAKQNFEYSYVDEMNPMFRDWVRGTHKAMFHLKRIYFSSAAACYRTAFPAIRIPQSISEGSYSDHEIESIHLVMEHDERIKTSALTNKKFTSWQNILFRISKLNFDNPKNQPQAKLLNYFN